MKPMFHALQLRNFRWFIAGQLTTNVGTWMQRIAQDWLVLELTHGDAVALGVTTALQFLPFVLLAPIAGVLADRFPRKRILAVAGLAGGATAAALGILVLTGHANIMIVYLLAFGLGTAAAFEHPARQAFLSELVPAPNLANAVALNSASFNMSRLLGPALAGTLIATVGVAPVFLLNGASFFAAVLMLVPLVPQAVRRSKNATVTFSGGIRYARDERSLLLVLIVVGVMGFFAFNFAMFTALMATGEFGVGAAEFGLASTVLALGSIVGSLWAAKVQRTSIRRVFLAGLLFSATIVASGFMPTYTMFLLSLPLCGIAAMTFSVSAMSFLQTHTDDQYRGRIMGLYALVFFGGNPLGAPLLGLVADQWGPRWGLLLGGSAGIVALLGLGLLAYRWGLLGTPVVPQSRPEPVSANPITLPATVATSSLSRPNEVVPRSSMSKL